MPPGKVPFVLPKKWNTRNSKKRGHDSDNQTDKSDNNSDHFDSSSDDDNWEWIYEDKQDDILLLDKDSAPKMLQNDDLDDDADESLIKNKTAIVGARNREFQIKIGDAISVNCGDPVPWVAIVRSFDDISKSSSEKSKIKVKILWLSNHTDISNKLKKRMDYLTNELYLTPLKDSIDIRTINGPVKLMSVNKFNQIYPNGISKKSKENNSVFVCRRGCEARGAFYTDEFIWEKIKPNTEKEVDELHERIKAETQSLKQKNSQTGPNIREDNSGVKGKVETPRKKQKFLAVSPRKLKTPSKLVTPSHKRVMVKKPLEFTPLGTRILDFDQVASSPFQTARCRLHVSSVPVALPCRENEFASVYSHLEAAIIEGTGACIYISGTPGTGKTATVREVVAQLQAAVLADELDSFNFVEINGMKITDPVQSYSLLWEALKGERISPIHALDLLEREFTHPSPRRTPCVVLMDELDQLVTKNQLVMYNFFNWPGLRHSRLIVLAVANTMDLPERTLSNKISSRLGLTRITFPGYSFNQLVKIITSRLEDVPGNIVEKDAIEFASRKVAAVSGDARRVLDICRRAVEIAENEKLTSFNPTTPSKTPGRLKGVGRVSIDTIRKAIKEATTSPLQTYLRELPLSAKLLLIAFIIRTRRTGIGEDTLGEILDEGKKLAKQNTESSQRISDFLLHHKSSISVRSSITQEKQRSKNHKNLYSSNSAHFRKDNINNNPPRLLAMGAAAINLAEAGIIVLETRKTDRTGKIRLCVGEEDIKIAFRDDPEVKSMCIF
ncbi:Origin recognition complex subunit 1 [Golovinomyces cichoracearum]|uniref:Origin recognition complex subunit 1 n=1 Tax=Golovinomyces cichoracearum TaxID=62708 RepID=A0A420IZE9_9PEZI|nr:Origin recognition complex subunit 1 [Golovinomyces cichoracearum]